MTDSVNEFKEKLPKDHVLSTMINEHEIILNYLNELEILNINIQRTKLYKNLESDINRLKEVIDCIIAAEPHHQREENVLFIELEINNIIGPPKMMRWEHHEIRELKNDIKKFVENISIEKFQEFKDNLNFAVSELLISLREHIFKENNILYPMAFRVINDENKWIEMKKKCDEIGYCSFMI